MKKVLIFYAAYGGGHLSAARSIKEYIENNYDDVDINLVDCVKYVNKTLDKLTTTAYNEMAKKAPRTWGRVYWKSQSFWFTNVYYFKEKRKSTCKNCNCYDRLCTT